MNGFFFFPFDDLYLWNCVSNPWAYSKSKNNEIPLFLLVFHIIRLRIIYFNMEVRNR